MEKIYNYMDKIGIEYEKTTFGSSYFKNVPPVHFEAAYITLERDGINTKAWKDLERYCRRNGYDLKVWGGYPGHTVFSVMKNADREILNIYLEYQQESVSNCEHQIHVWRDYHGNKKDSELNEILSGIMELHGEWLSKALEEHENSEAA